LDNKPTISRQNFHRLESSNLPQNWVADHPDGWDSAAFERFLGEIEAKDMWPIDRSSVHELLVATHKKRTPEPNRTVRREDPTAASLQTATRYGTSDWADPVDFADRHLYKEGDLWLGRDTVDGRALGFRDERHAMILGSTRGYKGTTCIVPAHLTWPGSLFSLDPKGENATISAARRGQGNDVCVGMGQSVNVLDPFGEAQIEDQYRKRFNPLDALRPDDPELIEKAASIADAMVVRSETENEPFWNNKARALIKGLILHIVTSALFEGRRNLITLRHLAVLGDTVTLENLKKSGHEDETKNADGKPIDPFTFLFKTMQRNKSLGTVIAGIGTEFYNLLHKGVDRQWSGFHSALTDQTEFLDSPLLQKAIETSDFELTDIKDDPNGMSLYLCLPTKHMATYHRWLRVMTNLVIYECRKTMAKPARGHRVLMCLDEFRTLEHMPEIERDISNLAGYGVKLMMVLQDLGQLKKNYSEGWETIWGSCGLVHAFAINDDFTLKMLSEHIGETDLILDALTQSEGINSQQNENASHNTTVSESGSESQSASQSRSQSKAFGRNSSTSRGTTTSDAAGWNQSQNQGGSSNFGYSTTRGRNSGYDSPRLIGRNLHRALPMLRSNETAGLNRGSSTSSGGGQSWGYSAGMSHTQTKGTSDNISEGSSETSTEGLTGGTSESVSRSSSDARAVGRSVGTSRGQNHSVSIAQSHHKRPLIYPHDIKYYFASLKEDDRCFPGLGLVLIPSERPMVVQRVNYYEDDQFDALWDFNPSYPETVPNPVMRQWIVGFEIEKGCLWEVGNPVIGQWFKSVGELVQCGMPLCEVYPGPNRSEHGQGTILTIYAPVSGQLESIDQIHGEPFVANEPMAAIRFNMADAFAEIDIEIPDEISEYNNGGHTGYLLYAYLKQSAERLQLARERLVAEKRATHEYLEAERLRLAKEREAEAARLRAEEQRIIDEKARADLAEYQALKAAFHKKHEWVGALVFFAVFLPLGYMVVTNILLPFASGWMKNILWAIATLVLVWLCGFLASMFAIGFENLRNQSRTAAWKNKEMASSQPNQDDLDKRRKNYFKPELRERTFFRTFSIIWIGVSCVMGIPAIFDSGLIYEAVLWISFTGPATSVTAAFLFNLVFGCVKSTMWLVREGEFVTSNGKVRHKGY